MRKTKLAMLQSVVALILCAAMLVGTTFAWFTDEVTSAVNKIQAGTLDVDLVDAAGNSLEGTSLTFMDVTGNTDILWEPGCTFKTQGFRVANRGSLALEYTMYINGLLGDSKLLEVIRFSVQDADGYTVDIDTFEGQLSARASSDVFYLVGHMDENAGNEYMNLTLTGIGITVYATQAMEENDSFGPEYDKDAFFPGLDAPILGSVNITTENDLLTADAYIDVEGAKVTIPAGTRVKPGTTTLKLRVKLMDETTSDVKLSDNQVLQPMDVTVEGVSDDNQVPLTVELYEIAPVGLNMGSIALHHVHKGVTAPMTRVAADAAFTADNQYRYDPATGDLALHMATFSEVAVVADTVNPWEGKLDYTWYDASKTALTIANADQLAAFGAIVGGMKKVTGRVDGKYTYSDEVIQDSFAGKTVKLIADINLGDDEKNNVEGKIFYPIGYWNNEGTYERKPLEERTTAVSSGFYAFSGTFDGNGNTISNFYQNTWEMKGDHDWYDATLQYFRDGMGLFGRVYKGTVKNLTVKNFSSDGEITTTGCVAAYADGATFENIAIFNCNPRVYNIGNGGIVGCVGWYAKEANLKTTFANITVDNSNKISALWGSYDVACGGIVGQYYPTSGQSSAKYPVNAGIHFENCHVSAVMDVYNDVCANYQYYAYRYTGMLIGSVRENETIDGHVYPKMDKITATDCTVHFGTWNDYYYCEIIDNTTASYTHDYQMSRLTEIKAIDGTTITYLDGTTGTVPASGRANYVIVDYTKGHGTENATCYHFKDGAVWTHDMGGIQTGIDENGDGQDDLKEDKQHIYLEFNNIVTGYGWGVTSKGLTDFKGVDILDITEGEHEESVNKFAPVENVKTEIPTESQVTIGKIFAAVENAGVAIKSDNVQVTVSPFGATSTAGGTYVANTTDWTQGTLTFSGVGQAVITITDYYFCKTTSITVNIIASEKFDTNFVNYKEYLYRVGNADKSTVALGTIFRELNEANIDSSSVNVEFVTVAGNASGAFTANSADWTKGTIQFSGTGVVKVTISAKDTQAFNLYLEVVDAVNATGATSATENNVVLLNNTTSSGFTVSNGYAFYGNGFKVTCSGKGTYLNNGGLTRGYVNVESGGLLDNTQIICDIYPAAFVYASEVKVNSNLDTEASTTDKQRYMYQLSAIAVSGDGSAVSNCYAYGGRNNIFVGGGNVKIENTVTECGTLANIQIKSSSEHTVILKDIVTNQYKTKSPYDTTKTMLGFGILIGDNESTSNPVLRIQNSLTQYNWVTDDDTNISNEYAKQAIDAALAVKAYQHTYNGIITVNSGIIYLNDKTRTIDDQRTDHGYVGNKVSIDMKDPNTGLTGTVNAYVYSLGSSSGNYETNEGDYIATTQGDVRPSIEFNLGTQAVAGEDRYLKGDINGIEARYEEGQQAFRLDITKLLTASKHGIRLDVTAYCLDPDGIECSNIVTLSKAGTYTLKFIVNDNVSFNSNGELQDKMVERIYTVSLELTIAEPAIADAVITINQNEWNGEYTNTSTDGSKNLSFNLLQYVSVTDAGSTFNLKGNGGTAEITYSATSGGYGNAFGGVTTIKVTYKDGQVLTMKMKKISGNAPGDPKTVTYNVSTGEVKSSKQLAKNSCTAQEWQAYEYSFKGLNGKTVTSYVTVTIKVDANTSGGGCFTPDTLITLADGTQKRVDELTFGDKILAWDFFTGTYVEKDIALLVNHGESLYRIANLAFSDGTALRIIAEHGVFDYDLNKFVYITVDNMHEYVGHRFVQYAQDGSYSIVTLTDAYETEEYTSAWSITSAGTSNAFASGLLTVAPPEDFYNWIEMDGKLHYDVEQFQKDVQTYGLYTYEDFKDYVTYEQFVDWNGAYLKIAVEKGYFTFDYILELIELYKGWMPNN